MSQAITVPGGRWAGALRAAAVFGVCAGVVAACSSSPAPRPKLLSSTRPTSTASASAATHVLRRGGYPAARKAWLAEGEAIDTAGQGIPLERAVTDLGHAEVTGSGIKSGYPAVIAALKNLEHFPDAMDTQAEDAQARADAEKIDRFFRLSGNRGCSSWPSTRKLAGH
jgi:hypothetical protein